MKKLPDTNTILRYLLKDNRELFQKAFVFFENVRKGQEKAIILESVLTETVYVLIKYYNVPREEISNKLKEFLLYKGVLNDDKEELIRALDIFSSSNLAIVDCILCAKARNAGFEMFSFDDKLNKICGTGKN
jgi:predicted nucleic-acid-binding protein